MEHRLAAFELERWLRRHEPDARWPIGGSGVPRANLAPFLPATPQEWERLWRRKTDDATREVQDAVGQAYGVAPHEVVPTQGASEADAVAVLGLAGPGAHVVVEEPAYFALLEPARAMGCRVTRVRRRPEDSFRLDPGAVARALTPDTRLVITAQPHNPTGARSTDAELRELAQACDRVGAWLLTDEVFADATGPAAPARLLHDRIVTANSLTKCLGFGPLHVGWLVAHHPALEALDRAKSHLSVTNPILDLGIAARILARRAELLAATAVARAANAPLVERLVAQHGLAWSNPRHGTTCVVRLPPALKGDLAFARHLLRAEGVLVAPGSYIELPGWLRIGLVGPSDALRGGLEGLGRALAAAKP